MTTRRSTIFFAAIFLAFSISAAAQSSWLSKYSGNDYWLKNSLSFWRYGDTKLMPNDMYFPGNNTRVVNRGQKVRITEIIPEGDFARLGFSHAGETYTLLISNSDKRTFNKAFQVAFSDRPISDYWSSYRCESKMRTKKDVIRCYGYPLNTRTEMEGQKKVERLSYSCWFLGNCSSWDLIDIVIVDGKITDSIVTN